MSSSKDDSSSAASSDPEDEVEDKVQPPTKKQRVSTSAPLELAPSVKSTDQQRKNSLKSKQKVIVLLDQARLETVKNRRGIFELVSYSFRVSFL